SLVRLFLSTAATYSYVTVNAYNLWALFPVAGQSLATNSQWQPDAPIPDFPAYASFGPVPAVLVGSVALVVIAVVVSCLVARRPDRLTILVGVCALALAFFGVPTRVHERYLFPWFALAAIPIAFSARWRIAYAVATVATFLNMYVVLTTLYTNNPSISDWLGIGSGIRSFWGVAVIALLNTGVLVWGLLQLRTRAARSLEAERADGRAPDSWDRSGVPGDEGVVDGSPGFGRRDPRTAMAAHDDGRGPPVVHLYSVASADEAMAITGAAAAGP